MLFRSKNARNNYRDFLNRNRFGQNIYKFTKTIKDHIKKNILDDNIFGEFGLDYIGPVNGHDFHDLFNALKLAKEMNHSVVVHVHTIKGKGYSFAEEDKKGIYHGVSSFNYKEGILEEKSHLKSWSSIISSQVKKNMEKNKDIVVITPAMIHGSCLEDIFESFPERSFDVGITEEHAMTFAAGLSCAGKFPYITIYSSFLQRAYDQINHDIARMNLPCLIGVDRSGLVGADGETHHGVFDLSFLTAIPRIVLMTPKDAIEAKKMVNTAFQKHNAPYVIRFPKEDLEDSDVSIDDVIEIGTWEWVCFNDAHTVTVVTYDSKVNKVKKLIEEKSLHVNLINARFIKPIDTKILDQLYELNHHVIVYETDLMIGSLGTQIAHYYSMQHKMMSVDYIAIDDHFTPQGTIDELLEYENISINNLYKKIEEICCEKRKN